MPAIPLELLLGGVGTNESHTTEGTSMLDILNGLAYDLSQVKGSAPATITSPAGTAVPAITSPAGTVLPTVTAPLEVTVPAHGLGSALGAYADANTPSGVENAADRTRLDELRTNAISNRNYMAATQTEVAQLRTYMAAIQAEIGVARDYLTALRTEVVALRATQTTRAGLTLHWSAQSTYTP